MEELPYKLKLDFAMKVNEHLFQIIKFFRGKERGFITWISALLKPIFADDEKYIYKEGEEVTEGKMLKYFFSETHFYLFTTYSVLYGERISWLCTPSF